MKKRNIIYTLGALLISLSSCQQNTYEQFDSEYGAVNIWVGTELNPLDSTSFNYSYTLTKDSLMFYARIIGTVPTESKTFTLEAYEGDIDKVGNSLEIGQYTFAPGEYFKQFPICFDPTQLTPDDSLYFAENEGYIKFRLKESEQFVAGAYSYQSIHVILKNAIAKPDTWDEARYPQVALSKYFGSYSEVKYKFIIQQVGAVDFKVQYNQAADYDEAINTFSSAYAKFLKNKLILALEEYNEANGTLYDEYGFPVTF